MAILRSPAARRFLASVNAGVFSRVNTGIESPAQFPGLQAWYDVSDLSSMRNDAGAIPSNGEGVKLISDKSGNSSTNVLCLNGVAGNYASAPDSVPLSITGDILIEADLTPVSWASGANQMVASKCHNSGQYSYQLFLLPGGGLRLSGSANGTTFTLDASSSAAVSFSALQRGYIRATRQLSSGGVKFYTSTDGVNWVQLGTTQATTAATSYFDGTDILEIGTNVGGTSNRYSGLIHRVRIYNTYDSADTPVFDANFATASKLAPSFTESSSNAATVTINTSGATGARISGARDLYQGTAANQPILTIAAGGNYLTFDGSNDYLKAAAFALSQPETVYFVGSQVTWTVNDTLYDGNTDITGALYQALSTPEIRMGAGSATSSNAGFAVATNGIITGVFNNAGYVLRVNRNATSTGGTLGASNMNGFTLGARGTSGSNPANITASEVLVYSTADSTAVQDAKILYLGRHNGIAV